jgi:hypothetical protein
MEELPVMTTTQRQNLLSACMAEHVTATELADVLNSSSYYAYACVAFF